MTAPILRLEAALARLGAAHEPPWGWQTRVLAAVKTPRRQRGWWLALPAAAALALPLALVRPPPEDPLVLRVAMVPVGRPQRGSSAQVGDRVHAQATGGDHYRAIWVYRDHRELVVACPGGPSCGDLDDATAAEVTLLTLGTYELIALTSASPIPAPHGAYDADLAAAERAGATIQRDHVTVR
jgi:hypothetical protein